MCGISLLLCVVQESGIYLLDEIRTTQVHIWIFVFGTAIGSFLNACVYRLPRSISLINPRSMCPECHAAIRAYDNIPLLSYVWLLGRCRHCGGRIPLRYPLVELVSGLFAVGVFMRYGLSLESLLIYVFIAALLVVTFIDIDHQIIPDLITCPGIVIGFVASLVVGHITYKESLLGIALGGGALFAVAWAYYLCAKKEGMGGGDIKLLAMIGAFLGWKAVVFTVFVASAVGTAVGILVALHTRKGRELKVPFGPFLGVGAMVFIFFGPQIIDWYVRIAR